MRRSHLSDSDLIRFIDGELATEAARCMQAHLDTCAPCRARLQRLESTAVDLAALRAHVEPAPDAETAAALAHLQRRMAAEPPPGFSARLRHTLGASNWKHLAAACAFLATALVGLAQSNDDATRVTASNFAFAALPAPHLTPGATRSISAAELCSTESLTGEPIPREVEEAVVMSYGMAHVPREEYELDYLIPPELGGAPDPRNLWPERYSLRGWNAQVKDELEHLLPQLVCRGVLPLEVAQAEIARDWIAAYKKYFRTEVPLRSYAWAGITLLGR